MGMNDSQKEKQKTTTATTRITKLSIGLLASVIVLSSMAAAQLFVSDNINAAFAAGGNVRNCKETTDEQTQTVEIVCSGGGGLHSEDPDTLLQSGGGGGHDTCITDSTGTQTCTSTGGFGGIFSSDEPTIGGSIGGQGGQTTCTFDPSAGDDGESGCSKVLGGGGSKP